MSKKRLTNSQMLEMLLETDGSENDGTDFSDSGSDYFPSSEEVEDNINESSDDSSEYVPADEDVAFDNGNMDTAPDAAVSLDNTEVAPNAAISLGTTDVAAGEEIVPNAATTLLTWKWSLHNNTFVSKYTMPMDRDPEVLLDLSPSATEYDVFRKFFPKSLYIRIAKFTNQRLTKLNRAKGSKRDLTDEYEIMTFMGVSLIVHYNHLPAIADYCSQNSAGRWQTFEAIKESASKYRRSFAH